MYRIYKAFLYSLAGLKAAFKTEPALRQEVYICIILIPLAIYVDESMIAKIILIQSLILVIIAELCNSAIEATIDRISKDIHNLSKKAKDVGSAIVFVAIINAIICWFLVLYY
jgi:diacylglycerol kinase (ATP)